MNMNVYHRYPEMILRQGTQRQALLSHTASTRKLTTSSAVLAGLPARNLLLQQHRRLPSNPLFSVIFVPSPALVKSTRPFSSNSTSPRRAGRERFYVQVGVEPCPAPWDDAAATSKTKVQQQSSPISAGVDGTDSASGVVRSAHNNRKARDASMLLLRPRAPARNLRSITQTPNKQDETAGSSTCWFTVTLDGRPLRTPMGRPLAVPSEHVAHAIAVEWNDVRGTIQPPQMPVMTLACTALDQVAVQPDHYRQQCLRFLQTDTVCYWTDPVEDRVLYARQQRAWKQLHAWIQNEFAPVGEAPAQVVGGMNEGTLFPIRSSSSGTNNKTVGLPHSPPLRTACEQWVHSLDAWHLAALHSCCAEAKSFFVAAAVMTGHLDAKAAQEAARVEEEFQIDAWGLVEGQHDYDRLNATVQLTAASLLTDCLLVE